MQLEINGSILIFIGWFIRASFQLACIQCTSPIRRTQNWDHSCLDGTLLPLPCQQQINDSILPFKTCMSALYTLGLHGKQGKKND